MTDEQFKTFAATLARIEERLERVESMAAYSLQIKTREMTHKPTTEQARRLHAQGVENPFLAIRITVSEFDDWNDRFKKLLAAKAGESNGKSDNEEAPDRGVEQENDTEK